MRDKKDACQSRLRSWAAGMAGGFKGVSVEKIAILLAVINMLCTAGAYVVALRRRLSYDDTHLRSAVRQLDADLDDVFDRLKRLTSRKGMQAKREETAANPFARLANETDAEWKARARKLRNKGTEPVEPH